MKKFTLLKDRLPITPERRELLLQAGQEIPEVMPFLFKVTFVPQCDQVLTWLIRNRLTGHNLLQWLEVKFGGTHRFLPAAFFILSRLGHVHQATATVFDSRQQKSRLV